MSISRRDFLESSIVTSGLVGLSAAVPGGVWKPAGRTDLSTPAPARAAKPLRILILGGTGFIGPYQVQYAVARGHKVTVFNRGKRQADLPKAVEHLQGDRNGQLDALKGRQWDVCIDNPTTFPKWVRDAGAILKGNVNQYVFISTISTYANYQKAGMDEDWELAAYKGADPYAETKITGENYGPLKVLSEKEAEKWFPGKTTIIRPGLIVGPGDESDRFTYWPVRIDRGGEVLAPNLPDDPVQIIDARDLSEWTIRMCEQGATGVYNATGPVEPISIAEELYGIRAVMSGNTDVRFTWVPAAFLAKHEVRPWMEMTTWVPNNGDNAGWGRVSVARALAKGLTYRPLAVTAKDTLDWWKSLPEERRSKPRAGLAAEKESTVLAAWHAENKTNGN
jgi:2'-hydroxyisoflavone reductase